MILKIGVMMFVLSKRPYQVTVKNSTAANSGAGFYEADKTVTIHAGSRSNYTFIGWTTSSGVTFANAAKAAPPLRCLPRRWK